MSVTAVDANGTKSIGSLAMQVLQGLSSNTQPASETSSSYGDLMTISSAAHQLTQAPAALTQALKNLLSGKQPAQSDIDQLQSYLEQNPQGLASILSSLQGGNSATYSSSNSNGVNGALLATLMQGQGNNPHAGELLTLFSNSQGQDSLFGALDNSGAGAYGSSLTLLG